MEYSQSSSNGTSFVFKTCSLASAPGVNNNSNFVFRFMSEFEGTATGNGNANYVAGDPTKTYGTAGSIRYDMVTVSGVPATPPVPAVLNIPVVTAGQLGFAVTGSSGATYVVQVATNLIAPDWVPVYTNISPFTFNEPSLALPQRYYRAVSP